MQLDVRGATRYWVFYCLVDHLGFKSPLNSIYVILETKNKNLIKSIWKMKKIYLSI